MCILYIYIHTACTCSYVVLQHAHSVSVLLRHLEVKGKWKDTQGLQVRLLRKAMKAGADVNFQNCQGNSALHFASHRGDLDVVEVLLSLKASPKLVNAEGNTALMYAAHGGYEEICTALLEAAAPVAVTNRAGLTAETMADRRNFKTCAALIHAYELAPKQAPQALGLIMKYE